MVCLTCKFCLFRPKDPGQESAGARVPERPGALGEEGAAEVRDHQQVHQEEVQVGVILSSFDAYAGKCKACKASVPKDEAYCHGCAYSKGSSNC